MSTSLKKIDESSASAIRLNLCGLTHPKSARSCQYMSRNRLKANRTLCSRRRLFFEVGSINIATARMRARGLEAFVETHVMGRPIAFTSRRMLQLPTARACRSCCKTDLVHAPARTEVYYLSVYVHESLLVDPVDHFSKAIA